MSLKKISLCLGLSLVLCQGQVMAQPKKTYPEKKLVLNNRVLKERAIVLDQKNRMPLVPIRHLSDRLALDLTYQNLGKGQGRLVLSGNGKKLIMDLGSNKVQIEEWSSGAVFTKRSFQLSGPVQAISNKTYVPLDLFSKVLNYGVVQSGDRVEIHFRDEAFREKFICKSPREVLKLLERAARARERLVRIRYDKVDLKDLTKEVQEHLAPQEGISSISYVDDQKKEVVFTIAYRSSDAQAERTRAYVKDWVKKNIQPGDGDLEKITKIHDEVLDKASYYPGKEDRLQGVDVHTAESIIYRGQAVCQGYAQLVYLLSREAGLEAYLVPGPAKMDGQDLPHAWNLVKIDGDWYHLDATWDDALKLDPYRFFLKGDQTMAKTRSWPEFFPKAPRDYQYK